MINKYFDLHVFLDRKNSFSVPLKTNSEETPNFTEEEIINFAVKNNKIDSEEAKSVDYIKEIDEQDYNSLENI